ncbi:hypothetical protein ADUPG1_013573 [Aduncisulcus paluster]|uniref:Uncharacterized protein n=1 Tax=Aduncisulcus paluster TaxID=2918883 RepID=A0ABQ5K871_9EUKA|nr:hypothetical protein ADUPG1_013573 [Aduncisulcus paluster]
MKYVPAKPRSTGLYPPIPDEFDALESKVFRQACLTKREIRTQKLPNTTFRAFTLKHPSQRQPQWTKSPQPILQSHKREVPKLKHISKSHDSQAFSDPISFTFKKVPCGSTPSRWSSNRAKARLLPLWEGIKHTSKMKGQRGKRKHGSDSDSIQSKRSDPFFQQHYVHHIPSIGPSSSSVPKDGIAQGKSMDYGNTLQYGVDETSIASENITDAQSRYEALVIDESHEIEEHEYGTDKSKAEKGSLSQLTAPKEDGGKEGEGVFSSDGVNQDGQQRFSHDKIEDEVQSHDGETSEISESGTYFYSPYTVDYPQRGRLTHTTEDEMHVFEEGSEVSSSEKVSTTGPEEYSMGANVPVSPQEVLANLPQRDIQTIETVLPSSLALTLTHIPLQRIGMESAHSGSSKSALETLQRLSHTSDGLPATQTKTGSLLSPYATGNSTITDSEYAYFSSSMPMPHGPAPSRQERRFSFIEPFVVDTHSESHLTPHERQAKQEEEDELRQWRDEVPAWDTDIPLVHETDHKTPFSGSHGSGTSAVVTPSTPSLGTSYGVSSSGSKDQQYYDNGHDLASLRDELDYVKPRQSDNGSVQLPELPSSGQGQKGVEFLLSAPTYFVEQIESASQSTKKARKRAPQVSGYDYPHRSSADNAMAKQKEEEGPQLSVNAQWLLEGTYQEAMEFNKDRVSGLIDGALELQPSEKERQALIRSMVKSDERKAQRERYQRQALQRKKLMRKKSRKQVKGKTMKKRRIGGNSVDPDASSLMVPFVDVPRNGFEDRSGSESTSPSARTGPSPASIDSSETDDDGWMIGEDWGVHQRNLEFQKETRVRELKKKKEKAKLRFCSRAPSGLSGRIKSERATKKNTARSSIDSTPRSSRPLGKADDVPLVTNPRLTINRTEKDLMQLDVGKMIPHASEAISKASLIRSRHLIQQQEESGATVYPIGQVHAPSIHVQQPSLASRRAYSKGKLGNSEKTPKHLVRQGSFCAVCGRFGRPHLDGDYSSDLAVKVVNARRTCAIGGACVGCGMPSE